LLILRWLANQALKARELISLALTVAICLWVSGSPSVVQRAWRTTLTGSIFYPLQAVMDRLHMRWNLERDMDSIRKDNAGLMAQNARLMEIAEMRQTLREFEPFRGRMEYPIEGARIVARDPLRLGGLWILDIGPESGVAEGMAVVSSSGLVGRILSASGGHAQMQTLADPDCRVAVLSTRSRTPGILHSSDGMGVSVEFSVTSDIRPGDSLVTWGAGGIFPRGLPVGQVAEVRRTSVNILRNAKVILYQDPWSTRDVFVILRPPQLRVLADSTLHADTVSVAKVAR
jgi:rod shape-determining protein MreC